MLPYDSPDFGPSGSLNLAVRKILSPCGLWISNPKEG